MTMINRASVTLFAGSILTLAGAASGGGDGWITSMDDAMATAKADGKSIIIDFTGSDWCGWCIKLDKEVFSQSLFQEYANDHFVLVELDFPRKIELAEAQVKHNEKWRDKFVIQGFPTIILADDNGDEFARTGYRPDGPAPYVDHLGGLLKGKEVRDVALAAAAKVEGIARAKMLDWAMSIEGITVPDSDVLMQEIVDLDSEDLAGLRTQYQLKLNDKMIDDGFQKIQEKAYRKGDPEGALEDLDALTSKYEASPEKAAELMAARIDLLGMAGSTEDALAALEAYLAREDVENEHKQVVGRSAIGLLLSEQRVDEAVEAFDRAIALDPESEVGKSLTQQRTRFMEYVEQMRNGTLESQPAAKIRKPEGEDG